MPKNTNRDKFKSNNRFLTWKISNYFNTQVIAKFLLKQQSLNQMRHWLTAHNQILHFFIKKYESISMTFKIGISQFYEQYEPKQWKWNKLRHFSMEHIQIWHQIFLTKKSSISMTLKIKISQFYDVSEPKQWKWNKIILFSIGNVQIWHHFSLVTKY